jgi:hypothetical protein
MASAADAFSELFRRDRAEGTPDVASSNLRLRHASEGTRGSLYTELARPDVKPIIADMPRKLKTYQTSLGFYDLAIAAPSMKAALEAWGAGSNLFHQGVAEESGDPEVVAATMSKPGVVLRRPVGSDGPLGSMPTPPAKR